MEKLTYSFEFGEIPQLNSVNDLNEGCFLCIWHANKIPPHIGIISNGKYFSLKVKGKDIDIPVSDIVKLINIKGIPTVFIKVDHEIKPERLAEIFSEYIRAEASKITCLTPITEAFEVKDEVFILSELLKYFESKKLIRQLFGLNLNSDFKGIRFYGKEEIEARLKQLSKHHV